MKKYKEATACEIYENAFNYLRKTVKGNILSLERAKVRIESAPGLIFHPPSSSIEILRSMESSGWLELKEKYVILKR